MRDEFLPFARPDLGYEEVSEVQKVLETGWITTGPRVSQFEAEFGSYVGASHVVAVSSCTAALHLGLEAMGVGEGDEVITTPYTFAATAGAVEYLRAKPVFVDIEPETLNLDPAHVEAAITSRTKVILPVHLAGQPVRLDELYGIAARHGLAVLEDCAHALPAKCKGRMIGADIDRDTHAGLRAHASCFSFYATKSMTTAEGGVLCSDSAPLTDRARVMSLHGMSHGAWNRYSESGSWFYEVVAPGFKYNMTDVAAVMGLAQLHKVEAMWRRRREIAGLYSRLLEGCAELQLPGESDGTDHSWHLYLIRLKQERLAIDRAVFIEKLRDLRIGTSVHFIPLHIHPYYRDRYGYSPGDFPVAHREYLRAISLPIYSRMTPEDARDVADAVLQVAGSNALV